MPADNKSVRLIIKLPRDELTITRVVNLYDVKYNVL